jgi:hypothetical protein
MDLTSIIIGAAGGAVALLLVGSVLCCQIVSCPLHQQCLNVRKTVCPCVASHPVAKKAAPGDDAAAAAKAKGGVEMQQVVTHGSSPSFAPSSAPTSPAIPANASTSTPVAAAAQSSLKSSRSSTQVGQTPAQVQAPNSSRQSKSAQPTAAAAAASGVGSKPKFAPGSAQPAPFKLKKPINVSALAANVEKNRKPSSRV